MVTISLTTTEAAEEEIMRLNSLGKYLRLHGSDNSIGYHIVSSIDGTRDEIVNLGYGQVLIDKKSNGNFDGIKLNYSDNPGWTCQKY